MEEDEFLLLVQHIETIMPFASNEQRTSLENPPHGVAGLTLLYDLEGSQLVVFGGTLDQLLKKLLEPSNESSMFQPSFSHSLQTFL
jgi:hypothetical protein